MEVILEKSGKMLLCSQTAYEGFCLGLQNDKEFRGRKLSIEGMVIGLYLDPISQNAELDNVISAIDKLIPELEEAYTMESPDKFDNCLSALRELVARTTKS